MHILKDFETSEQNAWESIIKSKTYDITQILQASVIFQAIYLEIYTVKNRITWNYIYI